MKFKDLLCVCTCRYIFISVYIFIIVITSLCIYPFIILKHQYISILYINIVPLALLYLRFTCYILFHSIIFCQTEHLGLKYISCLLIFMQSDNLWLLIRVLGLFTFNVTINIYVFQFVILPFVSIYFILVLFLNSSLLVLFCADEICLACH